MKKPHWTQTPEGKKKLSEQSKRSYASGKRKKRGPYKKKDDRTVEVQSNIDFSKHIGQPLHTIPLDAIPDRPAKPIRKDTIGKATKVVLDTRAELALALVKLVAQLTQEK